MIMCGSLFFLMVQIRKKCAIAYWGTITKIRTDIFVVTTLSVIEIKINIYLLKDKIVIKSLTRLIYIRQSEMTELYLEN